MRKQFELDGRRAAQQRGLTGKEADEFVRGHVANEQQSYEQRRDKQREEAGINDPSRYSEALQTIGAQATEKNTLVQGDILAAARHLEREDAKRLADRLPAQISSIAQAIADEREAASGRTTDRTQAQATITDAGFGEPAATPVMPKTQLAEATAQFRSQVSAKPDVRPDEAQDKRTDPSPPASTPAAAKASAGKSPA
jgi:hypothetical protein